ncbi:AIPR family protein [Flavobacterium sp. CHNK8]|uniref:AIPR family protein n=1 Tax=Flavobacterium sp. CHNK8 TaxID=2871165 RepID=UPI001C8D3B7B|nr:AIPR family protein [Flavobacterium sp. CHNK8]QZK89700.1 AIPR family protein [Flavobacterium sp. CHNK8]
MAGLNDYKIIGKKSKKYFELLATELDFNYSSLDEKQIERLGFYLFIIEHLSNHSDILDISDLVTDTEFNSLLYKERFDDCGIDAIILDEEEHHIQLYNFKYRTKFNIGKQSLNETILSSKFINAIINEDLSQLEGKTKKGAKEIVDKLNSNEEWKISLFVVSNEDIELTSKDHHLEQMEKVYGLEVILVGLEQISQFVSLRPNPVNAELIVDNDAIMSFSESSISSSKSYIIRLPLSEIIRITCADSDLRKNYGIEVLEPLTKVNIDYSVLFDNVRGLVVKSKYNKNISFSLKNDPTKFFMYNNGLTLTANDIKAEPVNANKKIRLSIDSLQVLNGGQSLRTMHQFNSEDPKHLEDYLSKGEVLVRIFKTSKDSDLNNKIAEYTNSQNSISNVDLKSLRSEQLQIEQFLDEHNIIYSRKTGDTGLDITKKYLHKISMERFGQILMSFQGMPERATNQKKFIFEKYYDELFLSDTFNLESCPDMIIKYFLVKKEYEKLKGSITASEQKVFYVIYMSTVIDKPVFDIINQLEQIIKSYEPSSGKTVTEARKLIQLNFKIYLDDQILPNTNS